MSSGVLYVVATPIGNLGDLSPRAVEVLRQVDLIGAEDTRHSVPLLQHFGISTRLQSLHDHNERQLVEQLLDRLQQGDSIALISDAGTPLISDPGFQLVRACHRQHIRVSPIPGACAAIAALSAAGIATDRFRFEGFPPRTRSARLGFYSALANESATLLFYESSHRVKESLHDMQQVFGAERQAVIARELSKLHETVISATLAELNAVLQRDAMQSKGEFVLILEGAARNPGVLSAEAEGMLRILCESLPLKQAAQLTARITGERKNLLYQRALQLSADER
ncbi:MAG: 16S rRNA (cytidine(1402)-2'-O)-methyltransferase [Gammaproteobacteria bacterium]|nr:16S rRNA (cytidine(1402)-2'-O)-methyltransferase [Gammaproteobacteria bacterium]